MAKDFAQDFYTSQKWIRCRDGYMQSKGYVCELCGDVAVICHHKEHLTPENINDPEVTLNWANLQAVCLECHNKIHFSTSPTREGLMFDKDGNLVQHTSPLEQKTS